MIDSIDYLKKWYCDKPGDTLGKLLSNRRNIYYDILDKIGIVEDDMICSCCGSDIHKQSYIFVKEMFENNLKNILEKINLNNSNELIENIGTPLHWIGMHYSKISGCLEIAKKLITYGADVNQKNSRGNTPLSNICKTITEINNNECMIFVRLLIESGADINIGNSLYLSSDRYSTELVDYLISNGADVNQKDSRGNTPLSIAIKNPNNYYISYMEKFNSNVIKFIEAGADLSLKNEYGMDAYEMAMYNKNMVIVDYIDSIRDKRTFIEWLKNMKK